MGTSVMVDKEAEKKAEIHEKQKEKSFNFKEWIVIDPMTMHYQIFKLIVVVDSIYSSLFYAVWAAFRTDLDYKSHEQYLELSQDAIINPITLSAVKNNLK